jgi:thioredoxin-dependent peroxiredoxin
MKLKAGDIAPLFEALDQFGNNISLKDFAGSKVILYFYPKDDTPGCTAEACSLRDSNSLLLEKGFKIIGVSADNIKSHVKFTEKYSLPFPLIADTDKKIIQDYGAWGRKKFLGREFDGILRTTFVIGEDGHILKIFEKINTKDHAAQILAEF